jgi:uncharacterized protein
VRITYDPAKRDKTLRERALDFEDAAEVFAGLAQTGEVPREDHGETQFVTVGYLRDRMVVLVWTPPRDDERRVISMRKANVREQGRYRQQPSEARRDDR